MDAEREVGARPSDDVKVVQPADLTRSTLQLFFIVALILGSFWVLRPFLVPSIWAAAIVVASWPAFSRLRARLGGSRAGAVALTTLLLLLIVVLPLYLAITTIVENADDIVAWTKTVATLSIPPPPDWVERIPLAGSKLAAQWRQIASAGTEETAAQLLPYARTLVGWFASRVGGVGLMFIDFLLTVVIAAILYANGESASNAIDRFARRLAGAQGGDTLILAAQAIRAVALGVVVTALVQSCLGGIGLAIAGVGFATILTAVMFILGVAQLGPLPVLVPAVLWVYSDQGAFWGTALLVWSVAVGALDNVLRPVLIRRGANLPLLLIFAGVLGGLIAFGVIGLFVGPVILAVAYTLLTAWVGDADRADRSPSAAD